VELLEGTKSSNYSSHYKDNEIVGPGFLSTLPNNTRLRPGQIRVQ
jgi:hypothetical protein